MPFSENERLLAPPLNGEPLVCGRIRPHWQWFDTVADINNNYPYSQGVFDELAYRWLISSLAD